MLALVRSKLGPSLPFRHIIRIAVKRLLFAIGAWSLLVTVLVTESFVDDRPLEWAIEDASGYLVWALAALLVYPLVNSTRPTAMAWVVRLPLLIVIWHLGGAVVETVEEAVHESWVHERTSSSRRSSAIGVARREFPWQLATLQFAQLINFVALVILCTTASLIRRSREREIERGHLLTQLTDARLTALRAQMQPHFLFNTLNTVATLSATNSKAAIEVLAQLSSLLRRSAAVDDGHFTTVKDEFTFLRSYVDIMQHRFGDRVSVKIDCDSDIESMSIPVLTLQPLVENAYVHGVGPRSTGGTIEVTGVLEGNCIKLIVSDNGVGEDSVDGNDKGIALDNLRSRLRHLYGGRESLATSSRQGGGFRAVILLPILLDPVEPK